MPSSGCAGGLDVLDCGLTSRLAAALAFGLLGTRSLHVDAAAEVCAFGDGDARRRDVAVDRPVVADVDLLASRSRCR